MCNETRNDCIKRSLVVFVVCLHSDANIQLPCEISVMKIKCWQQFEHQKKTYF